MKYDKPYFIKKFEAIPDENWTDCGLFNFGGKSCALGHCGTIDFAHENKEASALWYLLYKPLAEVHYKIDVVSINDGKCPDYKQSTPKARILAALRDLP